MSLDPVDDLARPTSRVIDENGQATLLDRLDRWVRDKPDVVAATMLDRDGETCASLTFGELEPAARRLGGALQAAGARGRPVMLPAEQTVEFVAALYACLRVGAIATPVPPALRPQAIARIEAIIGNAGVSHAVPTGPASRGLAARFPSLSWIDPLAHVRAPASTEPVIKPGEAALLQYSSGSTSTPKGIVITHANLAANLAMAARHLAVDEASRILTWLPLFHDMGLIGQLMLALYAGSSFYAMPPMAFVQRPQNWLAAISRYRITVSGASNFAYDLCTTRAALNLPADLRLDSWNVAFCGAEPVRAATLGRFAQIFEPYGFDPGALFPCYGLAEATVLVSGGPVHSGVTTLASLTGAAGPRGQLVSCGEIAGDVVIVDPQSRQQLSDGDEGEIWVAGEHVAAGYWNVAEHEAFGAHVLGDHERKYLRTGDYGLIESGQLFVTGRMKDVIIHRGMNLHPEDIERTIAFGDPRFGTVGACFAVDGAAGDEIVIVAEVASAITAADAVDMRAGAVRLVGEEHGVRLRDVLLVGPGTIPRTTSGKVRRGACRDAYQAGALKPVGCRAAVPEGSTAP